MVHPPDPPPGGGLYAERLMANVKYSERLKRKVLEINLDVDSGIKLNLGKEDVYKTLTKIGINASKHMEGFQICPGNVRKIFVWLKDSCYLDNFCTYEVFKVANGVKTSIIKPADKKEVTVVVKNLGFNTPDSLVIEYLNKHGNVVSDKVIYEKELEGPFKGLYNGNRKYLVDFSNGINIGSYHLLDGAKIFISYPGQLRTCARCHQIGRRCPGGGFAQDCETHDGPRVALVDHMKKHWENIGFDPSKFQLSTESPEDDAENSQENEDVPILNTSTFTTSENGINDSVEKRNLNHKSSGVVINNLPKDMSEEDIFKFLNSHGLDNKGHVKVHNKKKSTNIDVEDLPEEISTCLINKIHGNRFFNRKLYCRLLVPIHTPPKVNLASAKENEKIQIIPGLTVSKTKENINKNKGTLGKYDKSNFMKNSKMDDFVFRQIDDEETDISSDEEQKESGFRWEKSPLDETGLAGKNHISNPGKRLQSKSPEETTGERRQRNRKENKA